MKKVSFGVAVYLTIAIETLLSYTIFKLLIQRGFIYTFRFPISTDYLTFPFTLMFVSVILTACTIGILKEKETGEVQTVMQFFLSHVKHPVTLGSIILALFSFFIL